MAISSTGKSEDGIHKMKKQVILGHNDVETPLDPAVTTNLLRAEGLRECIYESICKESPVSSDASRVGYVDIFSPGK